MIYDRWNHSKAPPKTPPTGYKLIMISPGTNCLISPLNSAPFEIETQWTGITCMQLSSPNVPTSKTILDQLGPSEIFLSCDIYAFSSKRAQITVIWADSDLHLKMSTKQLTLCLLSFYGYFSIFRRDYDKGKQNRPRKP